MATSRQERAQQNTSQSALGTFLPAAGGAGSYKPLVMRMHTPGAQHKRGGEELEKKTVKTKNGSTVTFVGTPNQKYFEQGLVRFYLSINARKEKTA